VVLADGSIVEASPVRNPEIFYGTIGGYGGIGVILEATLELTGNTRVKRETGLMPIARYARYFRDGIEGQPVPVTHTATIFSPDYTDVRVVTYNRTDEPVSIHQRLHPAEESYALNRLAYWVQSEMPLGSSIEQYVLDPMAFAGAPVSWRNYAASDDVMELEPASRESSTYLLQEYFVPQDRFDEFVPKLRMILRGHDVNVMNISVRHALRDPGSLLAWARTNVFGFEIYYKLDTSDAALADERAWTRELTDAALSVNGSFYLPYRLNATVEQFAQAYPRAAEFVALKHRVDPTNKFRNRLIERYLQ